MSCLELSDKIDQVVRKVSKASIGTFNLKRFLKEVVEIASEEINANYCSTFLLVDKEGTLQLISPNQKFAEELKGMDLKYYVPKRNPLDARPTNVLKPESWEKEREFVENGNLGMGITALVAKTGETIRETKEELLARPEYRGKYEKELDKSYCTAVLEVPLYLYSDKYKEYKKDRNMAANGTLKVENPSVSKKSFDETDEVILTILAACASAAIDKMEEIEVSYQKLFGNGKLPSLYLNWQAESKNEANIITSDNELTLQVREELMGFSRDVLTYDIYGIKEIYEIVINIIKKINDCLGLKKDFINIYENVTRRFEDILGPGLGNREHLIHQFQVFLLGFYIINKHEKLQEILKNYLSNNCKIQGIGTLDNVTKVWFLSAVFHDAAYSIEKISDWLGNYFETVFSSALKDEKIPFIFLWETLFTVEKYEYSKNILIRRIRQRLDISFESEEALKLHRSFANLLIGKTVPKKKNHGLFGALLMNNYTLDHKNEVLFEIAQEVAVAIALHTLDVCKEIYEINLEQIKNLPFAFLLTFCDNSQEWGRPWMRQDEIEPGAIELKEIKISNHEIKTTLLCDITKLNKKMISEINNILNGIRTYWIIKLDDIDFRISYLRKDDTTKELANL